MLVRIEKRDAIYEAFATLANTLICWSKSIAIVTFRAPRKSYVTNEESHFDHVAISSFRQRPSVTFPLTLFYFPPKRGNANFGWRYIAS